MSSSEGGIARRQPRGDPRIAAFAAIPIVLAALAVGVASAVPGPGVTRLSPADAERSGATIRLLPHGVGGSILVEVEPPAAGPSLLAVSPIGTAVALADRVGELSGSLTLAEADGAQLRVQLPGLLAAAFATDASWLAVIDGRGALWRVDAGSGRAALLDDGPFVGSPIVAADGSLILLAVPSVEAPYQSHLVEFDPTTGVAAALSEEDLVYAAFPLDDGDLAIVVHDPGGAQVQRLTPDGAQVLAYLDRGAVNVAVAADGRIAFEYGDDGIFVLDAAGSTPHSIGIGSGPCFAPDGSSLLVRRGDQRIALAPDGSVLAVIDELAGFAGSAGCGS
jgi:hypothetical protein